MRKIAPAILKLICSLLLGVCIAGCSDLFNKNSKDNNDSSSNVTAQSVVENYAAIVYAGYQDSLTTAEELKTAIDAFLDNPSDMTLTAAKSAWLAARVPYGQTEAFRFYDGPIDEDGGPEGRMNAWPLDEAFIDYVDGNSTSGLINDTHFELTKDNLIAQNEFGGDANISTGYHAIEFLLWGQDLTEDAGAGERPYTDYVTSGGGTADHQERRAEYLRLVTEILVDDLTALKAAWAPSVGDNYRAEFVGTPDVSLAKIISGIATLSKAELAGQRISTALETGEREGEHSCFSDNTDIDIKMNAASIQNVYLGRYVKIDDSTVSGNSLYALVKTVDETLAERIKTEIETSVAKSNLIQDPFDQEIRPTNTAGNVRVLQTVNALRTQSDSLVEAGTKFNLTINTDM